MDKVAFLYGYLLEKQSQIKKAGPNDDPLEILNERSKLYGGAPVENAPIKNIPTPAIPPKQVGNPDLPGDSLGNIVYDWDKIFSAKETGKPSYGKWLGTGKNPIPWGDIFPWE